MPACIQRRKDIEHRAVTADRGDAVKITLFSDNMGRVARPPADKEEASVYWEDTWDARGKRFKANEVSCAHRTEAFGTIFVVTNLDNGKTINCPVQDRGPYARGRVLDFSLGAARQIGCDGLCRVTVRRAGYE